MVDTKRKSDLQKDNQELIEEEYEKTEGVNEKPGKRLRVKERHSKKSDAILKQGRVLEVFSKNYYRVLLEDDEVICPMTGRLKIVDFGQRSMAVVGDYVLVDFSGHPRIEEILERKNSLIRFIDKGKRQLKVDIAANIDQVIITASCSEPTLNLNLVDRYLCAVELSGINPVICINKCDLAEDFDVIKKDCSYYESLHIPVVYTSAASGEGIGSLKDVLLGKDSVFSGASGTGKSSLINRLDPGVKLKTGEISQVSLKGKHTTSNSQLIRWSFGGFLIDTPGIKTFGLDKNDLSHIPRCFPGFGELAEGCRFSNCQHINEDGCMVLGTLQDNKLPEERYQSYLNILSSLE